MVEKTDCYKLYVCFPIVFVGTRLAVSAELDDIKKEANLKHYKTYQKVLICILPFASVVILSFTAWFVLNFITFPPCLLYEVGGIYCPSCGMTRAVEALINGDILLSIHQNVFLIIYIITAILIYIELFAKIVLEKKYKLSVCNLKFLYAMLILLGIYTILRNVFPILSPV